MNSSDSEWPDNYEVEITESHRLSEVSFNETNNNGTLTFQGIFSENFRDQSNKLIHPLIRQELKLS